MQGIPEFKKEIQRIENFKKRYFEVEEKLKALESKKQDLQQEDSVERTIDQLEGQIQELKSEKSGIGFELWKRLKPV